MSVKPGANFVHVVVGMLFEECGKVMKEFPYSCDTMCIPLFISAKGEEVKKTNTILLDDLHLHLQLCLECRTAESAEHSQRGRDSC